MLAAPLLTALAACQSPADGGAGMQEQISMVSFTEDNAATGPDARATVAEAATSARTRPGTPAVVRGLATPDGSVGFNRDPSEARARSVADALVAAGVASDRIRLQPRGPVPYEAMPVE